MPGCTPRVPQGDLTPLTDGTETVGEGQQPGPRWGKREEGETKKRTVR